MARNTWLTRRSGGTYYLRAPVPKELQESLGKREIWKSLRTTDAAEARAKLRIEAIQVDRAFDQARRKLEGAEDTLSDIEVDRLCALWSREVLEEDEEVRREGLNDRAFDKYQEAIEISGSGGAYALARGNISSIEFETEDLLERNGYAVQKDSPTFRQVAFALLKAQQQTTALLERRQQGEVVDTPAASEAVPASTSIDGGTIRELIADYMADPSRSRSKSTIKTYRTVFRALEELIGPDTELEAVHRRHCERIRDVLSNLPPNATKRFPGMTLSEIATAAKAEGLTPIKPKTVNSYLSNLSSLFRWAMREWRIERNPAEGLQVFDPVEDVDRRKSFTTAQLQTIFSAPLYTGCKDDEGGYATPGPNVIRRGRFWVPLLSLWTGMRLGECCQLRTDDVREEQGVLCIFIHDTAEPGEDESDRRRVKTASGRRFVPVHPELIRIGFPAFVAAQQTNGHARLFPEIEPDSQGSLSGTFSKWFNDRRRFLGKVGLSGQNVSFHSFRHTYRDALREADISLERVRALGGWKRDSGGEESAYGSGALGITPAVLLADVTKLEFPELNLSHLY